jgi:hypothetical protein
MNRRERLMCTLRGESVDRPPVCFYEINGLTQYPNDPDPYNVYSHPSWLPLIDLAGEKSDRIVLCGVATKSVDPDPIEEFARTEVWEENGSRFTRRVIQAGDRTLTQRTRRDRDVNTTWHIEHLLKTTEDLEAFLELPDSEPNLTVDGSKVNEYELALGDSGIVALDTADPICMAASLFDLGTYTVIAMTEPELFRRLLDRFARKLLPRTEAVAKALPGRLWRIYGPEYASEPYLPPKLFREYVCGYVHPMIKSIQRYGGFARIHSHGNLLGILDDIQKMAPDGLDPIEPPPQGDVELKYVRERYGETMVLFGNLEVSDIENLSSAAFAETVKRSVEEGTIGCGRGFVLMPSACPYGRELTGTAMRNYETMIEVIERL